VLLSHHLAIQVIGAAGRTPTRIVPIRSRMPHVFGHGSSLNGRQADLSAEPSERSKLDEPRLVGTAGFPPAASWSQGARRTAPSALKTELRSDKLGGSEGTCTLSLPADNGLLRVFELRIRKWWEVLVMLQSSLPAFCFRHRLYRPAAGTPPKSGSGGGNHTHLKEFMRLLSVL
jgi:hypothetical protein